MSLTTYTAESREDITDAERLRLIIEEIETILADLTQRLERLENA